MTIVKAELLVGSQPVTVFSLGEFPTTGEITLLSAYTMTEQEIHKTQRVLSSGRQSKKKPLCRNFGTANCSKFIAGPNDTYNCDTCKFAGFVTDVSCKGCEYLTRLSNICLKNGYSCGTALLRSEPCQKLDWKLQREAKVSRYKPMKH